MRGIPRLKDIPRIAGEAGSALATTGDVPPPAISRLLLAPTLRVVLVEVLEEVLVEAELSELFASSVLR